MEHSSERPAVQRTLSATIESRSAVLPGAPGDRTPLCVDLDGTLIFSDLLIESVLLLLRRNPLCLLFVPWWLAHGRSALKDEVAARVTLDPTTLPYDLDLIGWLRSERDAGRAVWLCTGANERLARAVADHLGLFDGVLASDRQRNLTGKNKASCLVECFGERGFDYCGNEYHDMHIWSHARAAIVAHAGPGLAAAAARLAPVVRTFPARSGGVRAMLRASRR